MSQVNNALAQPGRNWRNEITTHGTCSTVWMDRCKRNPTSHPGIATYDRARKTSARSWRDPDAVFSRSRRGCTSAAPWVPSNGVPDAETLSTSQWVRRAVMVAVAKIMRIPRGRPARRTLPS